MRTRIYKYALRPTGIQRQQTGIQRQQLDRCGRTSRFLWNRLVKEQKYALHEIKNGRRATIENEYRELFANKELVGMRAKVVTDLAVAKNISPEAALELFVKEKTTKDTAIIVRKKDSTRALNWSARHLSWKYALEKVNSQRKLLLSPDMLAIWTGIQTKWNDFSESWDKGIFKAPRFKKFGKTSAIQKQIGKSTNWKFGKYVDLSWCGSPCLEQVEVVPDRPLPQPSNIKQIAVVKNSVDRWFICVFIEAEDIVFSRNFKEAAGKVVGIDPGMKSALTTSDGEVIQPMGISKQNKKERKLKRLQRKLDRQTRANNPHCYNKDGTWNPKRRITTRTKGMLTTTLDIADIKRYYKDAKADFYHNAAIKLLNEYDVVGVGEARMHKLVRGVGKSKKAMNTRVREHAISDFLGKLKDKSSLSLTTKQIFDKVSEVNTTRKCSHCGELTGPSGTEELSVREWTCSKCGTQHLRDVNAAKNIRTNTISAMNTTAAQAVSGTKVPKVRDITKRGRKIQSARVTEASSPQGAGLTQETVASARVVAQVSVSARTPQLLVTAHDTQVSSAADSAIPPSKVGCSQRQTCPTATQLLT